MAIAPPSSASCSLRIDDTDGSAMNNATWAYFCPMCGTSLDRLDFDKAPEHYACPFCHSQQTPSRRAADRVGWESPD
jgi:hypothetical protein